MSHQQFIVSDTNPNDTAGGGGCICDPERQIDCKGPFIVCYGNDMESVVSPHVVVGINCVHKMAELVKGEALASGEKTHHHKHTAVRKDDTLPHKAKYNSVTEALLDEDVPEV